MKKQPIKLNKMNKKVICLLIASFIFIFEMNAQENKFLVGGIIGTSYSSNSSMESSKLDSKNYSFDLSTSAIIGYFLSEKILIGIEPEFIYNYSVSESSATKMQKNSNWILSPLFRYYVNKCFLQANFNLGKLTTKYKISMPSENIIDTYNFSESHLIIGGSLGAGYSIKLTDKLNLEPIIRYTLNKLEGLDQAHDFNKSGLFLNIGMAYKW